MSDPEKVLKELKPPYFQRLLFIKLLENVLSNTRNVWYRFHFSWLQQLMFI
ncbi:MAG: hypothetical protein ACE5J9_10915 [Methanosarcinales archaeon]